MTADLRQAHTMTRDTTLDTTRARTTDRILTMELDRHHQQTMVRDLLRKATTDDRQLLSSQGRRLHLRRRGTRTIAKHCGGCSAP